MSQVQCTPIRLPGAVQPAIINLSNFAESVVYVGPSPKRVILVHNESGGATVRLAAKSEERAQISVRLTPDLQAAISQRAERAGISMNRAILQLLREGIESERNKKQHLEETLRRYRECTDPQEAQRLGDELGAMIFGK